jgi:putative tricarboxylic transport membrane protein
LWIAIVMGALGYGLRKLGFETAPIVLGAILAPMLELALRQSLAMSDGQYAIFVSRPISGTLLAFGAALVLLNLVSWMARSLDWRQRIPHDEKGENL